MHGVACFELMLGRIDDVGARDRRRRMEQRKHVLQLVTITEGATPLFES